MLLKGAVIEEWGGFGRNDGYSRKKGGIPGECHKHLSLNI